MNSLKPQPPKISAEDRTPLIDVLLELLAWQEKQIDKLEQEILKLKGETTKPKIKPSKMDDDPAKDCDEDGGGNAGGTPKKNKGPKRSKTEHLKIDATFDIQPDNIPEGSIHKGFRDVVIQDIKFETFNTCYRLAQYQTPDGSYVSGQLPEGLNGCHFGNDLISFILYQYHHQHVTQPLLLKQLQGLGVKLSSGRLSRFITDDLEVFHDEKDQLLKAGLSVSQYVHTDDTGARHDGKNGYCTHIGNDLFAWFSSTESKSRINFLSCLGQGSDYFYVLNAGAFAYMGQQKLPPVLLARLELVEEVLCSLPLADPADKRVQIETAIDWEKWLDQHAIKTKRHRRIVTEGALMGGLLAQGIPTTLGIVSDDAGQFNVFDHALCWIHAERIVNRLIPLNAEHVKAVDDTREQLWQIYRDLKAYKLEPTASQAEDITARFKTMCSTKTAYVTLNIALKRMGNNQHELLRVLDKPYLPLHNNLSERDIRDYVKKRKISGSTRSEAGRRCRDTFASLKKTCLKHKISFWHYLKNRLLGESNIPPLADLILAAATCD
jgi:Transposase IS66 family